MIDRSKIKYCQDCVYKDKPDKCILTPAECRILQAKEVNNAED